MYEQVKKLKENKSRAAASSVTQKQSDGGSTFQFVDNRPESVAQRKMQNITYEPKDATNIQDGRENPEIEAKENAALKCTQRSVLASNSDRRKGASQMRRNMRTDVMQKAEGDGNEDGVKWKTGDDFEARHVYTGTKSAEDLFNLYVTRFGKNWTGARNSVVESSALYTSLEATNFDAEYSTTSGGYDFEIDISVRNHCVLAIDTNNPFTWKNSRIVGSDVLRVKGYYNAKLRMYLITHVDSSL